LLEAMAAVARALSDGGMKRRDSCLRVHTCGLEPPLRSWTMGGGRTAVALSSVARSHTALGRVEELSQQVDLELQELKLRFKGVDPLSIRCRILLLREGGKIALP